MLSSAPGDATLASLLVGVGAGVSFALLSLLALTHTPAQWAAYAAWICTHGWGAAQAAVALAVLALLARVALCRLSAHAVLPPAERLAARRRNLAHLPAHFPNGWLRLCDSADAPMGVTQHVRLCGLDVALYRALGESPSRSGRGRVFALDAVCPHLGANMGAGGKVVGNALECPFHGWQFAGQDGVCQSIPYAAKIPSNAKVATWSLSEVNGSVFLHYDVDRVAPEWQVPSLEDGAPAADTSSSADAVEVATGCTSSSTSTGAAPWSGRFHGRMVVDVPGNVREIVAKSADSWTGEMGASTTKADAPAIAQQQRLWGVFGLRWSAGPKEWSLPADASAAAATATLDTSVALTLLGFAVPLLSFSAHLLHVGPTLLYTTLRAHNLLVRALLGDVVLLQAVRPDDAFVCTVSVTAQSRPDAAVRQRAGGLASLATFLALPLQRALSKLLLRLFFLRFTALCLPIYSLGRVRPLSLQNSKDEPEDDEQQHGHEQEEEEPQSASSAAPVQPALEGLRERGAAAAASAPSQSATTGGATTSPRSSSRPAGRAGYRSASAFSTVFLHRFYSASGVKKRDDMSW